MSPHGRDANGVVSPRGNVERGEAAVESMGAAAANASPGARWISHGALRFFARAVASWLVVWSIPCLITRAEAQEIVRGAPVNVSSAPNAAEEAPGLDAEGNLRLSLQGGFDSNVRRDYSEADPAPEGNPFAALVVSADGSLTGERLLLSGNYVGGARKFTALGDQDTVSQLANADVSYLVARTVSVGVEGTGKDRRGGARAYTDITASAFLDYVPEGNVSLRLRAGGHHFIYRENDDYTFTGPMGSVSVRYRLARRHTLNGFAFVGTRAYRGLARGFAQAIVIEETRRQDSVLEGGLGYSYRGPLAVTLSYSYGEANSSSFGESWKRHRLVLVVGKTLPFDLTVLGQVQAQLASYPDGFLLSADVLLGQDEENANSASLKVVRRLNAHLDLEGRVAAYQNRLNADSSTFFRHVSWLGVTARF